MPSHSYIFGTNSEKVMYTDYPYYWFAYYEGDPRTAIGVAIKPRPNLVTDYNVQFYRAKGSVFNEWWNKKDGHDLAPNKIYFFNQHLLHDAPSGAYNYYDSKGNVRDDSGKYIEQGGNLGAWYYITTTQDGTANEVGVDSNMPLCETVADIQSVYDTGEIPPKFEFNAHWKITKIGENNIITHTRCDMSEILEDEESPWYQCENQIKLEYTITKGSADANMNFYDYGTRIDNTYEDLVGAIDESFIDKILNGVDSLINGGTIRVILRAQFEDSDGWITTSGGAYFDITNSTLTVGTPDGSGDTIEIISEEEEQDDDNGGKDEDEPSNPDNISAASLLTTTYAMTPEKIRSIGQTLWTGSFVDNIFKVNQNPIENIVGAKIFPFAMSGESKTVKIGNVDFGQTGEKLESSHKIFPRIGNGPNDYYRLKIPKYDIKEFLRYGEFTQIYLYLPYSGIHQLDTNKCQNNELFLKVAVDVVTGACEYTLKAKFHGKIKTIGTYRCQVGEDIPITASNRAQLEMGYISSAIGTATSVATGNYVGAMQNVLGAIASPFHSSTQGTPSPSVGACGVLSPFVIIDYPVENIPSNYANRVGWLYNKKEKLSNLKGFTVIENPRLNHINCTKAEKERLAQLLQEGVVL